ncbi:hypothetical protein ACHQM5_001462 [Ranunculus cassubicifolius]
MRNHFISFAFLFFALFSLANSQSDSCASNISLNGLIPFETTSLECKPVWISQDFILRYLQTRANLWSFILSAPYTKSYIGIGFSTSGRMVGSSAMVGWINPNASAGWVLKQYLLGGQNSGQVVPDKGILSTVNNSFAVVQQSGRIYIAFQLTTLLPEPNLIFAVGPTNRIPASNGVLTQHQAHGVTRLDYVSGTITTTRNPPYTKLRRAHGILNMLGWGIALLIGVMAARYLKHKDPLWFYSHIVIQSVGFILGVSGIIAGFVLEDNLGVNVSRHKTVGVFVLILGSLQVIAFLARPDKGTKTRKYWNWYHYTVGRVLIILAVANVFYGIHVGNEHNGWNVGYGLTFAFLVVVAVVLEVGLWMKK